MSADAGPSSSPPTLGPLAFAFYADGPRVEDAYSRLLDAEVAQLDRFAVARRILAPVFIGAGCHVVLHPATDGDVVVRTRRDDPTVADPIPEADVRGAVCRLLSQLPDPPHGSPRRLAEAVRTARELARIALHPKRPRLARWVRDVAEEVTATIGDAPEPAVPFRVNWPRPRTCREPSPEVAEVRAAKAAQSAADVEHRESLARAYLDRLAPGRHPVPDLWTAYAAATPETERIGKHRFNALARERLGEPRKVRGVRLWVVPERAVLAEIVDRVARLTWDDRRAILLRHLTRPATIEEARAA